ncbi:hypothetical protein [Paenibacillus sp. FJAT-26967]|uniref:hypothetical protein n=1 Tax=Paenibacillus sp. FJAT-26967 TaxID=1729690 RepID=UPI000837E3CC|nr:hypothetical protein [Paenibacillus sp. FJAT-26967]
MIKQYFAEISLTEQDTLSDSLNALVNRAENEFGTPYVEIAQIVPTQGERYTVILNLDFPQAKREGEA